MLLFYSISFCNLCLDVLMVFDALVVCTGVISLNSGLDR